MPRRRIREFEGVGPGQAAKLGAAGIGDTDRLLEACRDGAGRRRVAETSGIEPERILRWVRLADLCRVEGVGPEFAGLLEASGVRTVGDLRARDAETLAKRMAAVNRERGLTRRVPSAMVVSRWISDARSLPRVVSP